MQQTYLVFDVESCGLHGEGFAVGWVVVQRQGLLKPKTLADGIALALPIDPIPEWVRENVLPHLPNTTHRTTAAVRDEFWRVWEHWHEEGALLAADVAWPVEARFLAQCVDDQPGARSWGGPYPLVDIASVRLAVGLDPLAEVEREPNETPTHNPLADARQSARLLMEALRVRR